MGFANPETLRKAHRTRDERKRRDGLTPREIDHQRDAGRKAGLSAYLHTLSREARRAIHDKAAVARVGRCKRGLERTVKPTIRDIAWAAGIYEGEGHARADTGQRPCTHVTVVQKDRWILDRLRQLFGGSIHLNGRGMHSWHISGTRARGFLMTIYGFLSLRRRLQADRALASKLAPGTPIELRPSWPRAGR